MAKFSVKKMLLSVTALASVAALSIAGTVAYLQDTDSDVNVMTLGNVSIEQHEYERVVDANGNYATDTIDDVTSYVLKDFTQAKPHAAFRTCYQRSRLGLGFHYCPYDSG